MADQEREINRVIKCIRSSSDVGIDTNITIDKRKNHLILNALEEIMQYRSIGTVEECREAVERQRAKSPEHFYKKYGKHKWKRTKDGKIDRFAFESGVHNGVVCEICGEAVCIMCEPNYEELEDCEEEYWICPNCGRKFYGKTEYCSCGQHLDWSDNP